MSLKKYDPQEVPGAHRVLKARNPRREELTLLSCQLHFNSELFSLDPLVHS
jgi:hypothetical protein